MNQVGSPYPGGPRREPSQAAGRVPLTSDELHDRANERRRRRRKTRKRWTALVAIGGAFFAAATLGYMLGEGVRTAGVEGTAEARDPLTTDELIISEMNRLLMELWEMEALERR